MFNCSDKSSRENRETKSPWFIVCDFRGQKDKTRPHNSEVNGEVSSNCDLFDLPALTIREDTIKLYNSSLVFMPMSISSVGLTEFPTFRMFYLILCLRCRLQIILEDCLIKLICLSLQCCCNSILCVKHI